MSSSHLSQFNKVGKTLRAFGELVEVHRARLGQNHNKKLSQV